MMYDLQVLAYQADVTRVATLQIGREQSMRTYPQIGIEGGHHDISHMGSLEQVRCGHNLTPGKSARHFVICLSRGRHRPGLQTDSTRQVLGFGFAAEHKQYHSDIA